MTELHTYQNVKDMLESLLNKDSWSDQTLRDLVLKPKQLTYSVSMELKREVQFIFMHLIISSELTSSSFFSIELKKTYKLINVCILYFSKEFPKLNGHTILTAMMRYAMREILKYKVAFNREMSTAFDGKNIYKPPISDPENVPKFPVLDVFGQNNLEFKESKIDLFFARSEYPAYDMWDFTSISNTNKFKNYPFCFGIFTTMEFTRERMEEWIHVAPTRFYEMTEKFKPFTSSSIGYTDENYKTDKLDNVLFEPQTDFTDFIIAYDSPSRISQYKLGNVINEVVTSLLKSDFMEEFSVHFRKNTRTRIVFLFTDRMFGFSLQDIPVKVVDEWIDLTTKGLTDFCYLSDKVWLNDEVINHYMEYLNSESYIEEEFGPKYYCFDTRFYTKLTQYGYKFKEVESWIEKIEKEFIKGKSDKIKKLSELNKWLIPVHVNENHWCLGVIDAILGKLSYYDPLNDNKHDKEFYGNIQKFIKDCGINKSEDDWDEETRQDIPQQTNSYDCGVLLCMFTERLRTPFPLRDNTFDTSDLTSHRHDIKETIWKYLCKGKL